MGENDNMQMIITIIIIIHVIYIALFLVLKSLHKQDRNTMFRRTLELQRYQSRSYPAEMINPSILWNNIAVAISVK